MKNPIHFRTADVRISILRRAGRQMLALLLLVAGLVAAISTAAAQVKPLGTQVTLPTGTLGSSLAVAIDGHGVLFVLDSASGAVTELAPQGSGYLSAGIVVSGLASPSGIAVDWFGNLYIAESGNHRVLMIPINGGTFGSPVQIGSDMVNPVALTVDPNGNLFVSDAGTGSVIELPKINTSFGSAITVLTGLKAPAGVAIDSQRNLYVAETSQNRIDKYLTATGYATRQYIGFRLSAPTGIAIDPWNNLFVADTGNGRVVEEPWAAGAKRYNNQVSVGSDFIQPLAIIPDSTGNLYVADGALKQVISVTNQNVSFPTAPIGNSVPVQTYNFNVTAATAVGFMAAYTNGALNQDFLIQPGDSCSNQTLASASVCGVGVSFTPSRPGVRNGALVLFSPSGAVLATQYLTGSGLSPQVAYFPGTSTVLNAQVSGPSGVAVDGNGNVFIADTGNNRVVEISVSSGSYGSQVTLPITGLSTPLGLNVDGAGNLFVVSNDTDRVIALPRKGAEFGTQYNVGNALYGPSAVATDSQGNVYVSSSMDNMVIRYQGAPRGRTSPFSIGDYVHYPAGLAVGGLGDVYFTMPYRTSVAKIPVSGNQYLPQVNLPFRGLLLPTAVVTDAVSNVYVLDSGNGRVVMLPWNGSGYGSQITVASGFNQPMGLAIDGYGNLYVADTGNNQIVKIDVSIPGPLNFQSTYLGATSSDSARSVRLQSVGNLPLMVAALNFPVDFPEDAAGKNPCISEVMLGGGSGCNLAIDFTPTVPGNPLSEGVTITSNNLNSTGSSDAVPVSGVSIGKLSQQITLPSMSDTTYGIGPITLMGTASSALPIVYSVLSGPAQVSGNRLSILGARPIVLQATQAGNGSYLPAPSVTVAFNAAAAILTVTPLNVSMTYGANAPNLAYGLTGYVNGDNSFSVIGRPNLSIAGANPLVAGTYTIFASAGTLASANYAFVFSTGRLTVNKATLQIKAVNASITYGLTIPQFGWLANGFANGDTASVISGIPNLSTTAVSGSPVGYYPILVDPSNLAAANYTFAAFPGTLRVLPAQLTVLANSATIHYGDPLPKLTYVMSGLTPADAYVGVNGEPSLTTAATASSGAGNYAIIPSAGSLNEPNYTLVFLPGTLNIQKATLLLQPADFTTGYGTKAPGLSMTLSGFLNGDTAANSLTGTPVVYAGGGSRPQPGTYPILVATNSVSSRNYNLVFGQGVLTVTPAVLTLTARPATMLYGAPLPAMQYDITGFVYSDTAAQILGKPSLTTDATSASSAGTYNIQVGLGTLASSCYTFQFVGSTLTVSQATATIVANPVTVTYGDAVPALTYSVLGLVKGDSLSVVQGSPSLSTSYTSVSPTGSYPISVTNGSLIALNYRIQVSAAKILVTKAPLILAPAPATMVYGGSLPQMQWVASGWRNGDGVTVISGAAAFSSAVKATTPVGTYPVAIKVDAMSALNYALVAGAGTITVTAAPLKVIGNAVSIKPGGAIPALKCSLSGFVNGETAAAATTGQCALSSPVTTTAKTGTFPVQVSIGTLRAPNYRLQLLPGSLVISE